MFTMEELAIINMYIKDNITRAELVGKIEDALQYVPEQQIRLDMKSTIQKLNALADENFSPATFMEKKEYTMADVVQIVNSKDKDEEFIIHVALEGDDENATK